MRRVAVGGSPFSRTHFRKTVIRNPTLGSVITETIFIIECAVRDVPPVEDRANARNDGVAGRAADGSLLRKAGVTAVVLEGGLVQARDSIAIMHEP